MDTKGDLATQGRSEAGGQGGERGDGVICVCTNTPWQKHFLCEANTLIKKERKSKRKELRLSPRTVKSSIRSLFH